MRFALVVLVLSLAAQADDWARQFPVSDKPELEVSANDARVTVSAWDKNQIDVRVHTAGVSIPEQLQVVGEQTGNKLAPDGALALTTIPAILQSWAASIPERSRK